jgi:hypothetical protein
VLSLSLRVAYASRSFPLPPGTVCTAHSPIQAIHSLLPAVFNQEKVSLRAISHGYKLLLSNHIAIDHHNERYRFRQYPRCIYHRADLHVICRCRASFFSVAGACASPTPRHTCHNPNPLVSCSLQPHDQLHHFKID